MQQPTCTNVRIRSTQDAHRIFFAVQKGLLCMVTRRLDANERLALTTGCVYAWEERGTHSEITGLGIERFTEGRRWSPSRVRDEFLFYYEKYSTNPDPNHSSTPLETNPPRNWDPLVKQTYSVWVDTDNGRRKWHLTAYFTQTTVDDLGTIDDIPGVQDLVAPPGLFKSTRVGKSRCKPDEQPARPSDQPTSISRTYAPFSSLYNRYPSQSPPVSESVTMYEPYQNMGYNQYPHQHPPGPSASVHHQAFAPLPSQHPRAPVIHPAPPPPHYPILPQLTPYPGPVALKDPAQPFPAHGARTSPSASALFHLSSPMWTGPPGNAPYADRESSPSYVYQGPYALPPIHVGPDNPTGVAPRFVSRAAVPRDGISHTAALPHARVPAYELSTEDTNDTGGRSGSIGPDRDLAPIHALTRRHPYRRDPLDDKTLRLLPR